MKNISPLMYVFIITFFLNTNCQARELSNDSIHNGVSVELNSFEEFQKTREKQYTFKDVELNHLEWNNRELDVLFQEISDWGDPGDFHKIILSIDEENFIFSNVDGWLSISEYQLQLMKTKPLSNVIKSNYGLVLPANETDLVLIVFGYPYASTPGLLTIIYLPIDKSPYLVYNDNIYMYGYALVNGIGQITVSLYDEENRKHLKNTEKGLTTYRFVNGYLEEVE